VLVSVKKKAIDMVRRIISRVGESFFLWKVMPYITFVLLFAHMDWAS